MEYQKGINFLDNTLNRQTKFRTTNWVEINDDARRMYNTNSQIKCRTSMLKSSLCDYSDAYILVEGTITIAPAPAPAPAANPDNNNNNNNNNNKEVVFKSFSPFTDRISEINNTQIDNTKDIDVVMRMYNLIEYSDNYSKTGSFMAIL